MVHLPSAPSPAGAPHGSGASTRAIALRVRRPLRSSRAAGALPWCPVACAHVPTAPLNAL